jgi:hypothetical protein
MAGSGKVNMRGAAIGHVSLPSLPGSIPSLAAVGRFAYEEPDHGKEHVFSVRMIDPFEEELAREEHQMFVKHPEIPLRIGEQHGVLFVVTFPEPTFNEFGLHRVTFYIDDELAAEATFAVEPEPEAPAKPE